MYVWQFDARLFKNIPVDEAWGESETSRSSLHNYMIELKDSVQTGKITIIVNGN